MALYDNDFSYLDTVSLDLDPKKKYQKYFSVRYDVFDKELKCPDDATLTIKLKMISKIIRKPVHHILFMIRVKNLNKNTDKFPYSKFRLTDFDINFQFDSHSFGKKFNLQDLRGGGEAEKEEIEGQEQVLEGALFFNYYLHRNPKYGWFIENLHSLKVGTQKELDRFLVKTLPQRFFAEFKIQMDYLDAGIIHINEREVDDLEDVKPYLSVSILGLKGNKFLNSID